VKQQQDGMLPSLLLKPHLHGRAIEAHVDAAAGGAAAAGRQGQRANLNFSHGASAFYDHHQQQQQQQEREQQQMVTGSWGSLPDLAGANAAAAAAGGAAAEGVQGPQGKLNYSHSAPAFYDQRQKQQQQQQQQQQRGTPQVFTGSWGSLPDLAGANAAAAATGGATAAGMQGPQGKLNYSRSATAFFDQQQQQQRRGTPQVSMGTGKENRLADLAGGAAAARYVQRQQQQQSKGMLSPYDSSIEGRGKAADSTEGGANSKAGGETAEQAAAAAAAQDDVALIQMHNAAAAAAVEQLRRLLARPVSEVQEGTPAGQHTQHVGLHAHATHPAAADLLHMNRGHDAAGPAAAAATDGNADAHATHPAAADLPHSSSHVAAGTVAGPAAATGAGRNSLRPQSAVQAVAAGAAQPSLLDMKAAGPFPDQLLQLRQDASTAAAHRHLLTKQQQQQQCVPLPADPFLQQLLPEQQPAVGGATQQQQQQQRASFKAPQVPPQPSQQQEARILQQQQQQHPSLPQLQELQEQLACMLQQQLLQEQEQPQELLTADMAPPPSPPPPPQQQQQLRGSASRMSLWQLLQLVDSVDGSAAMRSAKIAFTAWSKLAATEDVGQLLASGPEVLLDHYEDVVDRVSLLMVQLQGIYQECCGRCSIKRYSSWCSLVLQQQQQMV
jgi:hypothetical protein